MKLASVTTNPSTKIVGTRHDMTRRIKWPNRVLDIISLEIDPGSQRHPSLQAACRITDEQFVLRYSKFLDERSFFYGQWHICGCGRSFMYQDPANTVVSGHRSVQPLVEVASTVLTT